MQRTFSHFFCFFKVQHWWHNLVIKCFFIKTINEVNDVVLRYRKWRSDEPSVDAYLRRQCLSKPLARLPTQHRGLRWIWKWWKRFLLSTGLNWATTWENVSSGVCDQVRLKLACSATEATMRLEFLVTETRDITLCRQRTTKALIRLRGCAGWSAPLLFAYDIRIRIRIVYWWNAETTITHQDLWLGN